MDRRVGEAAEAEESKNTFRLAEVSFEIKNIQEKLEI